MIPTTADAVAASVACAAALGLPTDSPVVVSEGYTVRVRLDPAPVLTRVITTGRILRGEPLPWMQREVAVCQFLADVDAPVGPPWRDPGPHLALGLEVSLWQWLDPAPGAERVATGVLGPLLKELHDALGGYNAALPVLVGALTDIAGALLVSDDAVLHEAAERLVPVALTWPRRPVHGDAHAGNVLATRSGHRWVDLEDVCLGPVEWDLASAGLTGTHADAYPGQVDHERLEQCRDLRSLQTLAWVLTDDVPDPALYEQMTARLRERR